MHPNRVLLTVILSAAALVAQSPQSDLRGTVTDTAGAPVSANVDIIDAASGRNARTVTADEHGHYFAAGLKPGVYRINIDKERYQSFAAEGLELLPGETLIFDPKLTPGSLSDTAPEPVRVVAGPPDSGTITNLIEPKGKDEDKPVLTLQPSPFPLMVLTPGVQGNGRGVVISGVTRRNDQTWALDGIQQDATSEIGNPTFFETVPVVIANPKLDSYRPVHFDMVSRHGTDSLHGLLSYQRGSAALDARSFFDPVRQNYKSHQLEGQIGGTLIPGWTWFYGAWLTQKNPYHTALFADVPTAQMRALDFSQFLDPSIAPNGRVVVVRDPRTGVPFPGNRIPISRFSPVAQKFMDNYYPQANVGDANTFSNNYTWNHPFGTDVYRANWPFARIDQKLSSGNRLYFRWMTQQDTTLKPGSVATALTGTQARRFRNMVLADTHAFNSNLVNEVRLGRSSVQVRQGEEENDITPLTGDNVINTTGLQGVNAGAFTVTGFPSIAVAGLTGLSVPYGGGKDKQVVRKDHFWNVDETLAWSYGRHSIKFGAQYVNYHWTQDEVPQINYGAFTFNGAFSGLGFADFALGIPATSTRQLPTVGRTIHQNQGGLFLSDSYRVSSRLTLDFGVRWDYYQSPEYDDGYMSNWDPSTGRVVVAPGTFTAVSGLYPKNITVVTGNVVPKAKTTNFRPRISGAYRLSDKLVLRGGYGEFTQHPGYGPDGLLNPTNPFHLIETYTNTLTNGISAFSFPRPFPTSPTASLLPGQSVTALPQTTDEGVIRQFNLTLERQTQNSGIRASYIGMRGKGMNYMLDINKARASTAAFDNSKKPFPQFASAFETRQDGEWHYDSIVLEGRRRSGPLTFDANFTLGNNTSNYANTLDPYNVTNTWTRDAADRRMYLVLTGAYDLPFGKDKPFLANARPVVNHIVSNWSIHLVGTLASGQYYTPYFTGPDPSNTTAGFVTTVPDCVGDPDSGARTLTRWFNPAAFSIPSPTAGRYGTCGMNSLEGYPIHVAHVNFVKLVPLGERARAVFSAQITNVTNTPHFTAPQNNLTTANAGAFTAPSLIDNNWAERLGSRQMFLKLRVEW